MVTCALLRLFQLCRPSQKKQELANTAWAFATVKLLDETMFAALAREVERRVSQFNAQELANTAWAFATVNLLDKQLFAALQREAERRLSEFDLQELANTAWAFATVNQLDKKLFAALGRWAERRVSEFNAESLSQLHQRVLSQSIAGLPEPLSLPLRNCCFDAFRAAQSFPSESAARCGAGQADY